MIKKCTTVEEHEIKKEILIFDNRNNYLKESKHDRSKEINEQR